MKNKIRLLTKLLFIIFICFSLVSLSACQTLKRKFTRKSKTEKEEDVEEVIYEPQEYPAQVMSNEEMYRNFYTFWRGWHQELVEVLAEGQNHKKQVECITEIINNLNKMKDLLVPEGQLKFNDYLQRLAPIREDIVAGRSNVSSFYWMKIKLEGIKSGITKDCTPKKVKNYIIR